MAPQVNADTIATQLERVRDKLPLLYERDDTFLALLERRGDKVEMSSRAMRVPLAIRPGGSFGQTNFDGGDLGRGAASFYDVATLTPVDFKFAVEINYKVQISTDSSEKAVEDIVERETKSGMKQFRAALDMVCQTSGGGILATVASVASNTITVSGNFGTSLFYVGQTIFAFTSSALTTKRNTGGNDTVGSMKVVAIDPVALTVLVDTIATSTATNDVLTIQGIIAGSGTAQSVFGIPYHQNSSNSGTWLNLNRATYPEIRTPEQVAGSQALTTTHVRLALNRIRLVLGNDGVPDDLIAYMHLAQEHAYEDIGFILSEIIKGADANEALEPFFKVKSMAGVPIKTSIHADTTRIDFLCLSSWGRAMSKDMDYFQIGNNTVFPLYNSTSGGIIAAFIWYLVLSFQIFSDNPRRGSMVTGLSKITGY